MPTELPLHPLINKEDSPHYDSSGKETTIERFERDYTVRDLLAWATITEAKYNDPGRANKGEPQKDLRKALSYKNYAATLRSVIDKNVETKDMSAQMAYKTLQIKWRYQ